MPTAQSDGATINYEIEGPQNAPVLILSNSIATNLHMWDEQAPMFSKQFRVVRYDRRGHGKSSAPKGPYTMELLSRDALAVADAVGATKFNWCGLSLGGMVGQWLGANAPERLNKLVISNTNFYYTEKQPWDDRIKLVTEKGMTALADPMMERWFTPETRARSPEKVARVRAMLTATPVDGFVGCCQAIREMDFRESNKNIAVPTLVMVGAKDNATLPAFGEAMVAQIKGSKLATIPDAAHISNVEQPKIYADTVIRFLNS
jgi:3-oxoadipate enol-lactonase